MCPALAGEARGCADPAATVERMLDRYGAEAADADFGPMTKRLSNANIASHDDAASLQKGLKRYDSPTAAVFYLWEGETLIAAVGAEQILVGLQRMLQLASAQTVVMSLWSVDDAATAVFMTSFAEELKRSSRAARAYDYALQATRTHFPDPVYRGAFALFSTAQF